MCSIACLYLLRERPETEAAETSNQQSLFLKWCLRASRQPPAGLSLFGLGALLAGIKMLTSITSVSSHISSGAPVVWALSNLSWHDWQVGFLEGALPQLPLSTPNSFLAHTLYPERRQGRSENDAVLSRREVCLSVGWMNLILCPFGAMPNCHGAGGLAGQHKLGARHGASIVFLGASKMLLALCFGSHILPFLDAIPAAILGGA